MNQQQILTEIYQTNTQWIDWQLLTNFVYFCVELIAFYKHTKKICLPKENLKSRAGNGGFRGGQSAGAAAGTPRKSEGPTEFH